MEELRNAEPVDHRNPGDLLPAVEHRRRQRLAAADADPEARQIVALRPVEHQLVARRGGEANRRPGLLDRLQQQFGRRALQQHRRGAEARRVHQEGAEPVEEGDLRRAADDVARSDVHHMADEAIGGGEQIAVEMDRPLRCPRRARGEADDGDVPGRGVYIGEFRRLGRRAGFETVRPVAEIEHLPQLGAGRRRRLDIGGERVMGDRVLDPRLGGDVFDLAGPQCRHRGDRDPARLEDRVPRGGQHRVVARAQQHPVAGDQAAILHEKVGDAVRHGEHVAPTPDLLAEMEHRLAGIAPRNLVVEHRDRRVQPGRIRGELGQDGIVHFRPQGARRQFVGDEAVDMR